MFVGRLFGQATSPSGLRSDARPSAGAVASIAAEHPSAIGTTEDIAPAWGSDIPLIDGAQESVIITDADGTIAYWNDFAEQLYGWSRAEVIGKQIRDILVPQTSASEAEAIMETVRSGEIWRGQFVVRHRSGREFTADAVDAPIFDRSGTLRGIIGVSSEVKSSRGSAARTAGSSRTTPAIMPGEGVAAYAQVASIAVAILGITILLERTTGATVPLLSLLSVAYAAWRCGWRVAVVVTAALVVAMPVLVFRPHDDVRIASEADTVRMISFVAVAAVAIPLVDYAKRAMLRVQSVSAERDVALAERDTLIEQLQQANGAKDEFLSLVSHEMKTPITTVIGYAEVLQRSRETLGQEEMLQAMADIGVAGQRLDHILDDLLALARPDPGSGIQMEPTLVIRVVERVVAEHRKRFLHRTVNIASTGDTRAVLANERYVEQVLRNVLSNAEKYSPATQPIEVQCERSETEVRVTVRDHGAGIQADELGAIFEPFYRSPRTRTSASGIGVGLTVCRRLMEAQAGSISVRNAPDGGAEFTITIPTETEWD